VAVAIVLPSFLIVNESEPAPAFFTSVLKIRVPLSALVTVLNEEI